MQVLKDSATFEVISRPEDVVKQIATAARVCKGGEPYSDEEKNIQLVRKLREIGHDPMLEFGDMTVKFDMISRGFTHEGVRHRLCSFAQSSTRYVDTQQFLIVVPPQMDEKRQYQIKLDDLELDSIVGNVRVGTMSVEQFCRLSERFYRVLRNAQWKPEDARQFIPIGIKTVLVWKANMQEWRHVFYRRCDKAAHWEIRGIMCELLNWCKESIPVIFDDFYFFKTVEGETYARRIMPDLAIASELNHYLEVHGSENLDPGFLSNLTGPAFFWLKKAVRKEELKRGN